MRDALAVRIGKLPGLEVCGEAADVPEALALIDSQNPDIAIIDISLRNGDGIDLIKRIKVRNFNVRMLVWSMHSETLYAERALRAGAHGSITKEQATNRIVDAIRDVLDGKVYLSPTMTDKLLHRAVSEGGQSLEHSPVDDLSDRELEVFRLICQGVPTAEIAKWLHLSTKTVKTYRDRIRHKFDLSNGTELAHFATKWALENGAKTNGG